MGIYNMATLGLGAGIISRAFMYMALSPSFRSSTVDEASHGLFAIMGVLMSHPFEVARVMIVNNNGGSLTHTLRALFEAEGIAGLYKGFVPRAVHLIPTIMTFNYMVSTTRANRPVDAEEEQATSVVP